jgi:hypothetical protein
MISTCCSKHVEARNKHIEKECVKLVIDQNVSVALTMVTIDLKQDVEFYFLPNIPHESLT